MFGRENLLEQAVVEGDLLKDDVELKTFLILWKNYDEYLKRVEASHSRVEYTKDEFLKVQRLMSNEAEKLGGKILKITHETTKDEIFTELGNYLGEKVKIKKSRKWSSS